MHATEEAFRQPTQVERSLLDRLMQADFPGKDGLALLLRNIVVKTIDENGSLELKSTVERKAEIVKRVPVEAEASDSDGVVIHLSVHVVDGGPVEMELFREDGKTIKKIPPASTFELIVLPPAPEKGWTSAP
jgi:hypothetical protein